MRPDKMTVRKGHFYKGDKVVRPEHGNKEQIELLKKIEKMQEGFDPEISIKKIIHMEFTCVCGANNEFNSFTELDEDDPDSLIEGETDSCHYCGLKFKVCVQKIHYQEHIYLRLVK